MIISTKRHIKTIFCSLVPVDFPPRVSLWKNVMIWKLKMNRFRYMDIYIYIMIYIYIYTLWLFNIAMENCPFIDGLPGFT